MSEAAQPSISASEREVLKVLWEHGPAGVRDVQTRLNAAGQDWTRSTVITLLQRLERKGCVASDRTQFAFVFRAVVSREQLMRSRMLELADELSDGDPLPLVAAFAEQHRFTAAEVKQFKELIERLDAERKRRGGK